MPILPSGGGYPGIIGEAELIASAVASVAADKAASTAAAADALSARTAAQSDAGLALSARNAAQSDAGLALNARESAASAAADVSAAKAQAEAAASTIAGLVPGAQQDAANVADAAAQALADAGTVSALVTPAQADAQTIADLVAPAQADASAAGTAKDNAEASAAAAAAAVANMDVAPLGALASDEQVVRGGQFRSFNAITHQGCPTTSGGSPRSAYDDKGGMVIIKPATNTTDWCEARGRWATSDDAFWQGWRLIPTNKPFSLSIGVRVLSMASNNATEAYFLIGDPATIATPGVLAAKGLGFKVAFYLTGGNAYKVTPMWRKTGDASTQSGTSASFSRSDSYESSFRVLRLYIEGCGSGTITFGYFNNGTRVPVHTLTGATFTNNLIYNQFALQARHTAGTAYDAFWVFDKASAITLANI